MIQLYKFGSVSEVCDYSPFCVKVEAYLRLGRIPYKTKSGILYLFKSPKGKLPYIEDHGRIVSDSSFILKYLRESYGDIVDGHLTLKDKAIAHAFTKMIDENLYWVLVYFRWMLKHNEHALNALYFANIPFPFNRIVAFKERLGLKRALFKQGIGRHTGGEILEIGLRDLNALSDLLETKPYFFGEVPSSLDAAAYAVLSQLILVKVFTAPISDQAMSYKNLVDFTHRFHESYFKN